MKTFRQILEHHVSIHESDIDPQEIWEGILEKQKPKKRNRFYFFFSVAILFISAGLLLTFVNQNANSDSALSYLETIDNHKNKDEVATFSNSTNQSESLLSKKLESPAPDIISTTVISASSNSSQADVTFTKKQAAKFIKEPISSLSTNSIKSSISLINTTQQNISVSNLAIRKNKRLATPQLTRINKLPHLNFLPLLPLQSSLISIRSNLASKSLSTYKPIAIIAEKSIINLKLTAGIGYVNSRVHANETVSEDYLAKRTQSETSLESLSSSLSLSLAVNKRFSITSGIHYLRINERFAWNGTLLTDTDGNQVSNLVRDQEGNLILDVALFSEDYYEAVEQKITDYNQYELFSIPIIGEYNLSRNRLRSKLYAGAAFNFFTNSTGQILNEDLIPSELSNLDSSQGIRYLTGASLEYPIGKYFSLTGGLEYTIQNISISNTQKNYSIFSTNLGIQYKLY